MQGTELHTPPCKEESSGNNKYTSKQINDHKFNIFSEVFTVGVLYQKNKNYHSKRGVSTKKHKRGKDFSQWRRLDETWEWFR